jgi:ketosteroid isomerase-like protein
MHFSLSAMLPALFCLSLLALPLTAAAEFHFQNKQDAVGSEEQKLAGEIEAFLTNYEKAYNNQDYRKVKSMWHADGNPIYMAEEVPFPLYGEERLNNYFNPVPGRQILAGINNRYSEVRAKYIAADIAVATYRLDYDIKLVGMPAMHGWDRVMAVFKRDADGWKLTAYAEAPMGPATMVRKMMKAMPAETDEEKAAYATTTATIKKLSEAGVSPDFAEFLEARKDLEPTH